MAFYFTVKTNELHRNGLLMITLATVIIAIFTIVLGIATIWYAYITKRILWESQKSREATESLAQSSKESIQLLRQQVEQAAAIGRTIVSSAINAARTNIEQWKSLDPFLMAIHGHLPDNIELTPSNAQAAIEHSRLISPDATFDLIGGFENLRRATLELKFLSKCNSSSDQRIMRNYAKNALDYINKASADLEAGLIHLKEAIPSRLEK
jgi:hypothetical protein